MSKVYLVNYNNGEEWEDNHDFTEGIFSTYDKAVEYIESHSVTRKDNDGMFYGGTTWNDNHFECPLHPEYNGDCSSCGKYTAWNDEYTDEPCEYYYAVNYDGCCGWYSIQEYELDRPKYEECDGDR